MWIKRTDGGVFLSPDMTLSNASFVKDSIVSLSVFGGSVFFSGWAKVNDASLYDGRYIELVITPGPRSLLEAAEELSGLMSNTCFPQCVEVKLSNLNDAIERERKKVGNEQG